MQFYNGSYFHSAAALFFQFCFCHHAGIRMFAVVILDGFFQFLTAYLFAFQIADAGFIDGKFFSFACVFVIESYFAVFHFFNEASHIIFRLSRNRIQNIDRTQGTAVFYDLDLIAFGNAAQCHFLIGIASVNLHVVRCCMVAVYFTVIEFDFDVVVVPVILCQCFDDTCVEYAFFQHIASIAQHHCHFSTSDVVFGVEVAVFVTAQDTQSFQQVNLNHVVCGNSPVVLKAQCIGCCAIHVVANCQRIPKQQGNVFSGCLLCAAGKFGCYHLHIDDIVMQTISHCHLAPAGNLICIQNGHIGISIHCINGICRTVFHQCIINHQHSFAVCYIVFAAESTVFITAQQTFICYVVDDSGCPGHLIDIFEICCIGCQGQAGCRHHCRQQQCQFAFHNFLTSFMG